jgi:hypothetical protein
MNLGKNTIILVAFCILAVILLVNRSQDLSDISHESMRLHVGLFGASIYEYHDKTGKWPTCNDDLAKTSLPAISPYWKVMLDHETDVIVWHQDLKRDPKANADVILVYHDKGSLAEGDHRAWVCWGDLRTEYIKSEELTAYLQKLKK